MKITVVGSGGWGTALALLLVENGHDVTLWSHRPEKAEELRRTRENPMLKGVTLPETMHFVDSGYSVLTYDATGTGASGGSGTRGLAQSALDLDAALTRAEQEDLPILLFGHSWGGYAAAAVLGGSHDVTASV